MTISLIKCESVLLIDALQTKEIDYMCNEYKKYTNSTLYSVSSTVRKYNWFTELSL